MRNVLGRNESARNATPMPLVSSLGFSKTLVTVCTTGQTYRSSVRRTRYQRVWVWVIADRISRTGYELGRGVTLGYAVQVRRKELYYLGVIRTGVQARVDSALVRLKRTVLKTKLFGSSSPSDF
jgi:hypothetical protein